MLENILNNNPEGVKAVYQVLFPKVAQFVTANQGTHEDAKDIFQKTLLQFITRARVSGFHHIDSFEAYFFTACKNLWRKELNRRNRVTNEAIQEQPHEDAQDTALSILDQERWELFEQSIKKLSENCQEILKLYFKKVSYDQMKKQLSYASENAVRQRVFKCKSKLTKMIRENPIYTYLKTL